MNATCIDAKGIIRCKESERSTGGSTGERMPSNGLSKLIIGNAKSVFVVVR